MLRLYLWNSSSQIWRFATLPDTGRAREDSGKIGLGCLPINIAREDGSVLETLSGLIGIPYRGLSQLLI